MNRRSSFHFGRVAIIAGLSLALTTGCDRLRSLAVPDAGTTSVEPNPSTTSTTIPSTPPPSMEAPAPAETASATDDAEAPSGEKPSGALVEGDIPSDEEAQQKATVDVGRDNYKTELDEIEKELTH